MPQASTPSHDRFTLPGAIPDAATPSSSFQQMQEPSETEASRSAGCSPALAGVTQESAADASERGGEGRGYSPSHPAGRGWVPQGRDLGIPSDHAADDPIAMLGHGAVFTRERRVRFLDHLAFKGNARAAAMRAGVSHETAYRARRQDAAFAALWDAALVHARSYGEQVLATRALDGIEVNVWHHGELVGHDIRHDPRFLLAHLARLDRRIEGDTAAVARAGRFDELLARYAGHPAPEGFAEAALEARAIPWQGSVPADVPPTRAEYVSYFRGVAIDAVEAEGEADPEARQAAETELADAWCEEAGEDWDAWHDGSLALVGDLVEGAGLKDEGDAADHSPLAAAGDGAARPGAVEGVVAPAPGPIAPDPEDPDAVPADLPYEVKSARRPPRCAAALNRVTSVNPMPENHPEPSPELSKVETAAAIAHSAAVTRVTNEGDRETMNTFLKRFPLKAATAAFGAFALAVPAAAQFGGPPPPPNTGVPLATNLTSWEEVPGPGNGAGSGRITVVVDPPKGQLCYMFFDVYGIGAATAAHIHVGAEGVAGDAVVTLKPPVDGSSSGCQSISADLAEALVSNPAGYYVNVHTADFPAGALRGQLSS